MSKNMTDEKEFFDIPVVFRVLTGNEMSAKSFVHLFLNGELSWEETGLTSWGFQEDMKHGA